MNKKKPVKFVAFVTKNGKRIYAKDFGFKAFPITK